MAHNKPKHTADDLNPKNPLDVDVERTRMSNDKNASGKLAEAGRLFTPAGLQYVGSAAVHFYIPNEVGLIRKAAFASHVHDLGTTLGQPIAREGIKQLLEEVMRQYGVNPKTRDPRYTGSTN